jgi:hypothetical protein
MLHFLRGKVSDRKIRLFSCAAARHCDFFALDYPADAAAIDFAEQWVDGKRKACGLARARARAVREGAKWVVDPDAMSGALSWASASGATRDYRLAQCRLLRDVVGGLFRPVTIEPAWLAWGDGVISRLAEGIYQERAFPRLPILADALEDAGCADAVLLDHLRGAGPHVPGCWALDAVLGKE